MAINTVNVLITKRIGRLSNWLSTIVYFGTIAFLVIGIIFFNFQASTFTNPNLLTMVYWTSCKWTIFTCIWLGKSFRKGFKRFTKIMLNYFISWVLFVVKIIINIFIIIIAITAKFSMHICEDPKKIIVDCK